MTRLQDKKVVLCRIVSSSQTSLVIAIRRSVPKSTRLTSPPTRLGKRKRPSYVEVDDDESGPATPPATKPRTRLLSSPENEGSPSSKRRVMNMLKTIRSGTPRSSKGRERASKALPLIAPIKLSAKANITTENAVPTDPVTATFELHQKLKILLRPYAVPLELDLSKLTDGMLELLRTCSTTEIIQQQERDVASLQQLVAAQGASIWAEVTSLQNQCREQHEEMRNQQQEDVGTLLAKLDTLHELYVQGRNLAVPENNSEQRVHTCAATPAGNHDPGAAGGNSLSDRDRILEHHTSRRPSESRPQPVVPEGHAVSPSRDLLGVEKQTSIIGTTVEKLAGRVGGVFEYILGDVLRLKAVTAFIFDDGSPGKTEGQLDEEPAAFENKYMLRSKTRPRQARRFYDD